MRIEKQTKAGRIKVYRFRLYDMACEDFVISARMATAASIRRIHAEILRRTEMEIDKQHLNTDGMTEAGYADREASWEPRPGKGDCAAPNAGNESTRPKSSGNWRPASPWSRPGVDV